MPFSSLNPTSLSLLDQIRNPNNGEPWRRLVRLYTPLLDCWARRVGLSPDDADDRVQEVLVVLVQKLPSFEYDRNGRFRGWLWTVFINCCRRHRRRPDLLRGAAPLADDLDVADEIEDWAEEEYRRNLTAQALRLMRTEFPETTWQAFWEYVGNGRSPEKVARELGISRDAVYQAKVRVLRRLRQDLDQLL
jgi:RNA polymerase sigma-70 factor, ECF subfamily